MKKIVLALTFAILTLTAFAQYTGPGADLPPTTVKQLLASGKDDQLVTLRGHITKRLSDKKYQFSDGTGEILVKINQKYWPDGQAINEKQMVELTGEYDKEVIGTSKLEVKHIKVIR